MKWAWSAIVPPELVEDNGMLKALAQNADRKRDEHMPGYVFDSEELGTGPLHDEHGNPVLKENGEPVEVTRYVRIYDDPVDARMRKVTRVTLVDRRRTGEKKGEYPLVYEQWNIRAELDFQDDGRTLKVFVDEPQEP